MSKPPRPRATKPPARIILPTNPKWGYDPWLNTETSPVKTFKAARALTTKAVFAGADTVGGDIGLLPPGLQMYGSYIDNFGGYAELVARFGKTKAFLLSITIFGGHSRCADVEPGAMIPSDLPRWLDNTAVRDGGLPPWVYTSASNMQACNDFIGDRIVVRWSAHFGHGPHICGPGTCGFPQADWTQWDDHGAGGQNIDRSIGTWLPAKRKPKPKPDPLHYDWLTPKQAKVAKAYDKYRGEQTATKHPHRVKLAALRVRLHIMATDVWSAAHRHRDKDGKPGWDINHRGFRYQALLHRSQGKKVA